MTGPHRVGSTPLLELGAAIRALHRTVGEPSVREVAARSHGQVSHDTVHRILNCDSGDRTPRWPTTAAVVRALGGNEEEFRAKWVACREFDDATASEPGAPRPEAEPEPVVGPEATPPSEGGDGPGGLGDGLGALSREAMEELSKHAGLVKYQRGTWLVRQGEQVALVLVVLEGWAAGTAAMVNGAEVVVGFWGAGQIVALESVLDQRPSPYTVEAKTDLLCWRIREVDFRAALHRSRHLNAAVLSQLVTRSRSMLNQQIAAYALTPRARIAAMLLSLAEESGDSGQGEFMIPLPLSQNEIGQLVGMSLKTAQRILRLLSDAGAIETRYRTLVIIDRDVLRRFAAEPW